jgi:hypothetical protein
MTTRRTFGCSGVAGRHGRAFVRSISTLPKPARSPRFPVIVASGRESVVRSVTTSPGATGSPASPPAWRHGRSASPPSSGRAGIVAEKREASFTRISSVTEVSSGACSSCHGKRRSTPALAWNRSSPGTLGTRRRTSHGGGMIREGSSAPSTAASIEGARNPAAGAAAGFERTISQSAGRDRYSAMRSRTARAGGVRRQKFHAAAGTARAIAIEPRRSARRAAEVARARGLPMRRHARTSSQARPRATAACWSRSARPRGSSGSATWREGSTRNPPSARRKSSADASVATSGREANRRAIAAARAPTRSATGKERPIDRPTCQRAIATADSVACGSPATIAIDRRR